MASRNSARRLVKRWAIKLYRHIRPRIESYANGLLRAAKTYGVLDKYKTYADALQRDIHGRAEPEGGYFERLLRAAAYQAELDLELAIAELLGEMFAAGSRFAFRQIGFNATWSLDSSEARLALERRENLISGAGDVVFQRVSRAMEDALLNQGIGPVSPETLRSIQRALPGISKQRAETIARTESTAVINEAQHTVWQHNGVEQQEWIYSQSGYDRHADMDGEIVNLGDAFSNGCAYPGDPAGGPDESINCLCTVIPRFADSEIPTEPYTGG